VALGRSCGVRVPVSGRQRQGQGTDVGVGAPPSSARVIRVGAPESLCHLQAPGSWERLMERGGQAEQDHRHVASA
jgi:hypothetical protein